MTNVDALEHIILGRNSISEDHNNSLIALGMSANLGTRDVDVWRGLVSIDPLPIEDERESMAVGVFNGPDGDSILVCAFYRKGILTDPIYHYILFPKVVIRAMSVNISMLIEVIDNTIPDLPSSEPLPPIVIPSMPTLTIDKRVQLFTQSSDSNKDMLLTILDAALSEQRVCLRGFPKNLQLRLDLIQSLLLLLPARARSELTFTTHVKDAEKSRGRVIFCENTPPDISRRVINYNDKIKVDNATLIPYTRCLNLLWQGDEKVSLSGLRAIELIAEQYMPTRLLLDGVNTTAERFLLDQHVMNEEKISPDILVDILAHYPPPHGEIRNHYTEQFLDYALAERDADAAEIIVGLMLEDTNLGLVIMERLADYMKDEPDAVYFFVRIRLSKGVDVTWLPLLQEAAATSLQVAINDGDHEILLEWLRLIVREPNGYELGGVLRDAILVAQTYAHEDGALGEILLRFVCKRVPDLIETLLADSDLMNELKAPIGLAFREYDPVAVKELLPIGREISLVLMGKAVQDMRDNDAAIAAFSPDHIKYLWMLHMDEKLDALPKPYLPEHILGRLVNDGFSLLPPDSLQILLDRIVETETVAFFRSLSVHLSEEAKLFPMLVTALLNSQLPAENIIGLIGQIRELLSTQERVNIYLRIIEHHGWEMPKIQSLLEQIARLLQQSTDAQVPINALEKMLQVSVDANIDMVIRVTVRYILDYLDTVEDEGVLVGLLIQLNRLIKPNTAGHTYMFEWLREFVHRQPPPRLQQIDKLLNGNREMNAMRSVFQTSIAIRKVIGNRTLDEFAQMINLTFSILQAFSDSFDDEDKQLISFDHHTVITEFVARDDELPSQEGRILAKDLGELVQLIIMMSDNRMKSTIIRREDDIDRQLRSGEQIPQSAIDTMKWLAGYLETASKSKKEE